MASTSPEATFAEARAALERGEWETFFACFDRHDLLRFAQNSIKGLLSRHDETGSLLATLCAQYSFPEHVIRRLRALEQEMFDSAMAISVSRASGSDAAARAEALQQQSRRHKAIVSEHMKVLRSGFKSVGQLAQFTAALERAMRAVLEGGSVSSTLFRGEVLENVSVAGDKAWGTRSISPGYTEEIGFVQRKGAWYIRLFAKRPEALHGTL